MIKNLLLLVIVILVASCNKSRILVDVHEVDFINKSEITLKGTPVNAELPIGMRDLAMFDSYLIVLSGGTDAQMSVYSDDWNLLGRFCYIGRAKNEFVSSPYMISKQSLRGDNGHTLIPLIQGRSGIKVLDLEQSIESQRTVINTETDYKAYKETELKEENGTVKFSIGFSFVFLDDRLDRTFESYRPIFMNDRLFFEPGYAVMHDTVQIKYQKFLSDFYANDVDQIHGVLYKHPKRNLVIDVFPYIDYIMFNDLDKDRTFAIHQQGSLSFDDQLERAKYEVVSNDGENVRVVNTTIPHFAAAVCLDSYFMVLYYAGEYSTNVSDINKAAPELLFFDWDGNFQKSVKLDTRIGSMAYDEKNKVLYGLDIDNDRIISFDLSEL